MSSVVENLKLEQIRTDGGTQPRMSLNESTVADYQEALTEGAKMPPVTVFHDGVDYWLADGFHRFFAHKNIGALDIQAEIRQGTKRDAVLHSVGANAAHGLRRTNADKRKAVMTLLEDPEWGKWSDREVARQCGVSHPFVAGLRPVSGNDYQIDAVRTVERGGKTYKQNTANIGKKVSASEPPKQMAEASAADSVAETPTAVEGPGRSDPETSDDEIFGDLDMASEMESLQREVERLQAQIKAMSADDMAAQLQKEVASRQGIEARLAQEMSKANRLDTELRKYGKWASDLRKLLKVESNSQVTAAVKSLLAEVSK